MIAITFIILFIVAGFVLVSWLHYRHILKLEILLKARDLPEAKDMLNMKKEPEVVKATQPEFLSDVDMAEKSSEEIRDMFKVEPLNND